MHRCQLYNPFLVSLKSKHQPILYAYPNAVKSKQISLPYFSPLINRFFFNCTSFTTAAESHLPPFSELLHTNAYCSPKAFLRSICNKRIVGAYLNLLVGKNLHINPTGNQSGDITVHATGWHPPLLYTELGNLRVINDWEKRGGGKKIKKKSSIQYRN